MTTRKNLHLLPLTLAFLLFSGASVLMAAQDQAEITLPPAAVDHSAHGMTQPQAAPPAEMDHSAHVGHDMAGDEPVEAPAHDMAQMSKQSEAITALIEEMRAGMAAVKAAPGPAERKRLLHVQLATMTRAVAQLKESGGGAMMQMGKCPMMQGGHEGHGQAAMTGQGGCPKMQAGGCPKMQGGHEGHGAMMGGGKGGMMAMGGMGMCRQMMQQRADLTAGLLEQIIEVQTRLLETGN